VHDHVHGGALSCSALPAANNAFEFDLTAEKAIGHRFAAGIELGLIVAKLRRLAREVKNAQV